MTSCFVTFFKLILVYPHFEKCIISKLDLAWFVTYFKKYSKILVLQNLTSKIYSMLSVGLRTLKWRFFLLVCDELWYFISFEIGAYDPCDSTYTYGESHSTYDEH